MADATTTNLGLNIWQETDNVTLANFNAQFALIDQNAAARNQIGAASGIAGLDANEKLLPANIPVATASALGGVKQGTGVTIGADGSISVTPYSLPTASASTLGGVKIGSGITMNAGVISVTPYSLPVATSSVLGGVKQGSGVTIAADGTISATTYTLASASDTQLTTTAATTVATYTPAQQRNFTVKAYVRVVTAATNVTITVTYNDGTGAQTYTMQTGSLGVGSHSFPAFFFNATTGAAINVSVTAGTANQVYASASIVGE